MDIQMRRIKAKATYLAIALSIALSTVHCPLSTVYAASKGNPPVAYWRFDEGGGGTTYDKGLLSNNFYESRYDTGKSFFRNFTDNFADKPFVHSNDLTKFYNRKFRESAGFLVRTSQDKVKVAQFRCYMRRDSCYDNIAGRIIEFIRRYNKARPLFDDCKVSEWKGNEDNLALLISYHRQNLQDYPRSQKIFQLISKGTCQHWRFSKAVAVLSGVFAEVPQEIFESPVQPLLKMGSLSFTSIINSTILEAKCQAAQYSSSEAPQAPSRERFLARSNSIGTHILRAVTRAIYGSLVEKFSQRFSTGLACIAATSARTVLVTISDWLCPTAYAASKGNPPVAYWRFDEGGGGSASDSAGSNNGTLNAGAGGTNTAVGQMWTRQGKIGSALECDGTDDYVNIGAPSSLNITNTVTVGAWVKTSINNVTFANSTIAGNYSQYFLALSNYSSGSPCVTGWVNISGTGWRYIKGNTAINDGNWHHVAMTYDGSYIRVYHNGVIDCTPYATTGTLAAPSNFLIGAYTSSTGYYTNALIDDVRVYNYSRAQDQVLIDYNAGMAGHLGAGTDPNEGNPPVLYLNFNENSGTAVYDRSGNGKNSTFAGSPSWVPGKYGSAVQLNGTADYVSASVSVINQSAGTLEMWIKPMTIKDNNCLYDTNGWYFLNLNSNQIQWFGGVGSSLNYNTTLIAGTWYHIAVQWGNSGRKIYLNGQLMANDATIPTNAPSADYAIGKAGWGKFAGIIDEVKIYDYYRSTSQVAYDYNKGKPVAHYRFDEGGGTIAHNDYSQADAGSGCVGWWRMDNNWADSSGNGFNGTAAGNAAFTASSKIGPYAGTFDGTGDYVSIPAFTGYSSVGDFTLETFFYINSVDARTYLLDLRGDGSTPTANPGLVIDYSGGQYSIHHYMDWPTGGYTEYNVNISSPAGGWHHTALVRSGSTLTAYYDGVAISNTYTGPSVSPKSDAFNWSTVAKRLGTYSGAGGGTVYYLNGRLDDTRIYNSARTAEQIYNDYKTTHATLVGDTKFVDGKIGKALQFDGAGDRAISPDDDSLDMGTGDFTYSCWIKTNIGDSNWHWVMGKSDTTNPYTGAYIYIKDGKTYNYFNTTTTNGLGAGTITVSDNNWHNITNVYNRAGNLTVYVDGKVDATFNISSYSASISNAGSFQIGGNTFGQDFNGIVDDVKVYRYARSQGQVLQDYNEGKSARLGAQSVGTADPWAGAMPVGWWKLDENTGVLAQDASGNGNNGTLNGNTSWTQGKQGPCLSLDGTGDYVNAGGNSIFNIAGGNFTLCAWFKTSGTEEDIVANGVGSDGTYLLMSYLGKLRGHVWYSSNSNTIDSNRVVNDNAWHYGCQVVDNTKIYLYIDGVLDNSQTLSGAKSGTAGTLIIGSRGAGAGSNNFNGLIDDVRVYNYARTPAQIAWDYNKGKPVGYWRFDEASGTTCYDDSGNNNGTATIGATGTQTTIAAARTNGATGKYGRCLSLDGTDDYASAPHSASLDPQQAWTLSAWIKRSVTGVQHSILEKYDWASGKGNYSMRINSDNKLSAGIINGTAGQDVGTGTVLINAGTWYHVAATYDSSTNILITYVNGVLDAQNTNVTYDPMPSTVTLKIGARGNDLGTKFNGLIDDIRIYNYARTPGQILQDFNQGLSAKLSE